MEQIAPKHAYMILAHKSDLTFYTLLQMLDHPRNDLFIHMDIKNNQFDPETVYSTVKHSHVYLTERMSITWGDYRQVFARIHLIQKARETGENYCYYHFISGEDLPIQTQDYIHQFFDENAGKEFVNYEWEEFPYHSRVRYYYLFQDKAGRGRSLYKWIFRGLDRASIACQKLFKVWRNPEVPFGKGEAWASITKDMADYILDNRKDVEKWFKYTFCGDEEWFQTVADASGLSKNLYRPKTEKQTCDIMRLIDWNRGDPYVFRSEDWEELRDSDMLWARKFDARVDSQIIEKLRDYYTKTE